jgi:hypothetical protein
VEAKRVESTEDAIRGARRRRMASGAAGERRSTQVGTLAVAPSQRLVTVAAGPAHGPGPAAIAARQWHSAAIALNTHVPPGAAGPSSAVTGEVSRVARGSGTVRDRIAAIATRRWRHTHVPPGAGPPPAR